MGNSHPSPAPNGLGASTATFSIGSAPSSPDVNSRRHATPAATTNGQHHANSDTARRQQSLADIISSSLSSNATGRPSHTPGRPAPTNPASNPASSGTRPRPGGSGQRRRPAPQGYQHQEQQQQTRLIQCPLCGRNYAKSVIEMHAATCEGKSEEDPSQPQQPSPAAPPVRKISSATLEVNVPPERKSSSSSSAMPSARQRLSSASDLKSPSVVNHNNNRLPQHDRKLNSGDVVLTGLGKSVECPICNQKYAQTVIEEHAANCGEEVYV